MDLRNLARRIHFDNIQTIYIGQVFNQSINLIVILAERPIYTSLLRDYIPKAEYTKATVRYTSIVWIGGNSQNEWSRILEKI